MLHLSKKAMQNTIELTTLRDITEGELKRIRKAEGLVSVYDVIRAVTGHQQVVVRNTWKRLTETHPELVSNCYSYKFNKTAPKSLNNSTKILSKLLPKSLRKSTEIP